MYHKNIGVVLFLEKNLLTLLNCYINSVSLPFRTSKCIDIKRGIHQGWSTSPLLCIIATELAILVKDSQNIQPLNLMESSSLCFFKASGLNLNMKKMGNILAIQDHPWTNVYDIPIMIEVRYRTIELFSTVGFKETSLFLDAFYLLRCQVYLDLFIQPIHWIYLTY